MRQPHVEPIRVIYGDTDQMGIAYYANYLRWFEAARGGWLRQHGLPYLEIEASGAIFPVIEAHLRYRLPARYDDLISVEVWPAEIRFASLRFEYFVRRGDELLVEGFTVHACCDTKGRPMRFPDRIREIIAAGAGPAPGPSDGG